MANPPKTGKEAYLLLVPGQLADLLYLVIKIAKVFSILR